MNYLYKQFCNFSLQNYPIQSRSKRVTFNAEDSTFIWSFVDLIASTDHVKGESSELLAVKDPEVGAFVRQCLTSVVANVGTGSKCFKKEIYRLP